MQNIHLCLGWFRRDGDHHVEGEVGHGDPGPVLGHALERPVIIEVGPEQDELALERPVAHVGVGEVILPHICDHECPGQPPGDNGGRWPHSQVISGNNLLAFCEREMPGEYGW